jgi:hypothetical protein
MPVRIELDRHAFTDAERLLCSMHGLTVHTFRYASGVAALRLTSARGEIVVLPFQGQQIWSARFDGRDLAMRSFFPEPVATERYLENYGAFFIHCGLTAIGAPGPQDRHPLHGELPNAPFQSAWLTLDEAAQSATVSGSYTHAVAFSTHYRATATVAMRSDSAMLDIGLTVENLKRTPMDLMYLAHANFRPVDGGRLVYSAPYTPAAVRVRQSIPAHISPPPGYAALLGELAADPTPHHGIQPGMGYDPEVVFAIDMLADEQGWAHALQRLPDGRADYISYRPAQAAKALRWMCRTPDQDALGLVLPATAGDEGYTAEKARGNVIALAGGHSWQIGLRAGSLTAAEAETMASHIDRIAGRAGS